MSPPRRSSPLVCRPPKTLRFGSIVSLLESLPKRGRSESRPINVVLQELRWIEALPLAVLAAYVNNRRKVGARATIYIPPRYEFLQRMDLFTVIGADVPERFTRHDAQGRFVPLREVTRTSEVHTVAADVVATLRVEDPEAARVLRHCIGELVDNVFVHANSPTNATVCAQHFPNARRTQVGIVDTGVGFRTSFAESETLGTMDLSDRDAITLGLAPYVTSKPYAPTMPYSPGYGRLGVGLFIVSEVLAAVGGQVLVCSGDTVFRRGGSRKRWERVRPWQGAILGFDVPDEPLVSYDEALREARRMAREQAGR